MVIGFFKNWLDRKAASEKDRANALEKELKQLRKDHDHYKKIADTADYADARKAYLQLQTTIDTPWATFEIVGFDEKSQVKVEFNWNDAFIAKLDTLGFTSETPEDTVQLFFYSAQMEPTELAEDAPVNSQELPGLSNKD